MSIIDVFFPKHCIQCRTLGSFICANCFTQIAFCETNTCTICQKPAMEGLTHPICQSPQAIDGVFSSLVYAGIVKKMVYRFKYPPYITSLRSTLVDLFYEGLIQKEIFTTVIKQPSLIVPIPLHQTRFKKRGYNQSQLLAESIAKRFSLPESDLLIRVKKTQPQFGLSKDERETNIKGAFALQKHAKELVTGKQVFLIDDVATSGATLREAAKVLKRVGVEKVWGITLAHGE